jgi:hypothetical protein
MSDQIGAATPFFAPPAPSEYFEHGPRRHGLAVAGGVVGACTDVVRARAHRAPEPPDARFGEGHGRHARVLEHASAGRSHTEIDHSARRRERRVGEREGHARQGAAAAGAALMSAAASAAASARQPTALRHARRSVFTSSSSPCSSYAVVRALLPASPPLPMTLSVACDSRSTRGLSPAATACHDGPVQERADMRRVSNHIGHSLAAAARFVALPA